MLQIIGNTLQWRVNILKNLNKLLMFAVSFEQMARSDGHEIQVVRVSDGRNDPTHARSLPGRYGDQEVTVYNYVPGIHNLFLKK